ncbi:MAG: glutathione S-transferase family protein [Gammaproteobacteria bacterium]|nr:glutathione S-transferase family protein [Gammaproteobacteria bacterium]
MSIPRLIIGNKNYSSWSLRAWLLMKQSGIQFEEQRVSLYTDSGKAEIMRHSPSGKVPVLEDNGLVIWDSLAICEYLAERHPNKGLWPEEKTARSFARSISAEMHSGFPSLRSNMPMNCRGSFPGRGMAPGVAADIARIAEIWNECRSRFGAGGPMLFGRFTIADAMYAPVVLRFSIYGVDADPVTAGYMDTIQSLPALREWCDAARAETEILPQFEKYS